MTLIDMFEGQAKAQPNNNLYTFLPGAVDQPVHVTYGEVYARAQEVAAGLQKRFAVGDRVLLLFPCDLDYMMAFIGCIFAGVIPVPLYPPHSPGALEKVLKVADNCGAKAFLSNDGLKAKSEMAVQLPGFTLDEIKSDLAWVKPSIDESSIAFLQYTSGSTGTPKGVILTHRNLLSNFEMIKQAMQARPNDIIVSWLPMYHDMGLIGAILHAVYTGMQTVLLPPSTAVRPYRWLKAISLYKGTVTVAPNFAYDICNDKITDEQVATLDLSSLRVAFNGAEPVRWKTIDAFEKKFAPARLGPDVFLSCYGLAEATLIVSGRDMNKSSKHLDFENVNYVSCGSTFDDMTVKIVSKTKAVLPPFEVGEIWIAGPNVTSGYWNLPETASSFENGYFKTGDLGFLDDKGELYISGRLKDSIVIRGRTYAPQDLEQTARDSHPALTPLMNAAFSIEEDGGEKLVLAQEVRGKISSDELKNFSEAVVNAISRENGLHVDHLVFVEAPTLDRTSSGKIRRSEIKRKFLAQALSEFKPL